MLICLGYAHVDLDQAKNLLKWCSELDGQQQAHQLLLVASSRVSGPDTIEMLELGRRCFTNCTSIQVHRLSDKDGWPHGSVALFRTALEWMRTRPAQPFLWLEPDMIPTRAGWVDEIQVEYAECQKPFMGCVWDVPKRHLNAGCVYPPGISRYNPVLAGPRYDLPIDLQRPDLTVRYAHNTPLIQRKLERPVRGGEFKFPSPDSLNVIDPRACLFHGCKDGSLIDRLREKQDKAVIQYEVVLPANEATCFVCLGRYGDIMNALPLARLHFNQSSCKPHFMVAREFESILEGCGYLNPVVFQGHSSELKRAMMEAQSSFRNVVRCQVFGWKDGDSQEGKCYNHQAWSASNSGYLWADQDVSLVFDKRDKVRERKLVDESIERLPLPVMAVSLTKGNSSPFKDGEQMLSKVREEFGKDWNIVDLSSITAERIYDMLGILEQASMLITTDTSFIHLAAAVPHLPVYLLSQDHPWSRTEPRCKCVGRTVYSQWRKVWRELVAAVAEAVKFKVYHTFEVHKTNERARRAQCTWPVLWNGFGWIPAPLTEPYPRDARKIGDDKALPFIKDIWMEGLKVAGDNDIVFFCNDDIILLPGTHNEILRTLSRVPAALFSRRDIEKFCEIDRQVTFEKHCHFGRDILVARAWWLRKHWEQIPDFVIGRSDWDTCMTCLIRNDLGCLITGRWSPEMALALTACDQCSNYMLHEVHPSANMFYGAAQNANKVEWVGGRAPHAGNLWNYIWLWDWKLKNSVPVDFYWCKQAYDWWKQGRIVFKPDSALFKRLLRLFTR